MIVAGVGCRKGVEAQRIVDAVLQALRLGGLPENALGLLATGEVKRGEPGICEAATLLGVPLLVLDDGRLRAAASRCLTRSEASIEASGVPSLSEASAIVAAGPDGRLLGPRTILGDTTCALGVTAWSSVETGS